MRGPQEEDFVFRDEARDEALSHGLSNGFPRYPKLKQFIYPGSAVIMNTPFGS